jgi:hypothetical protein
MVKILREQVVSFADAAEKLPTKPHLNTVRRWARFGCHGVKLESVLIGRSRVTSLEALARFSARLSGEPLAAEAAT